MKSLHHTAAVVLCVIASVAGCRESGPALGTVSGIVTMDGQPLGNAIVTFSPSAGGGSSTGVTDTSGKYELIFGDKRGALVGSHKVAITTMSGGGNSAAAEVSSDSPDYEKQAAGGDASAYDSAASQEKIPAKYNANSELTADVKSGSNTVDFPLKSQ